MDLVGPERTLVFSVRSIYPIFPISPIFPIFLTSPERQIG